MGIFSYVIRMVKADGRYSFSAPNHSAITKITVPKSSSISASVSEKQREDISQTLTPFDALCRLLKILIEIDQKERKGHAESKF